jgi:hypothetical protein
MTVSSQDRPSVIVFPAAHSRHDHRAWLSFAMAIAAWFSRQFWPVIAHADRRLCDRGGDFAGGDGPPPADAPWYKCQPAPPTTALATDGTFRWTRNPLYSGGTVVMFGIALVFALDWLLLLIVPSVLLLHFGVVKREEQYLERKFGDQYRHYKLNVARYGLEI